MGCGASSPQVAKVPESKYEQASASEEQSSNGDVAPKQALKVPTLNVGADDSSPTSFARDRGTGPKTARGSSLEVEKVPDGNLRLKWNIIGDKRAGDGDWIGAFEGTNDKATGTAAWWDISTKLHILGGALVMSVMTNGKGSGEVLTMEPDVPGDYHFRYFFRDKEDEPAAVSPTIQCGGEAPAPSPAQPASPSINGERKHLRRNSMQRTSSVRLLRSRLDLTGPAPASQTMQVSGDVSYCLWSANVTEPGFYPEDPSEHKNQDAFCVHAGLNGDGNQHLFGVFDGHGPKGDECAQYVRDNLPETLLQSAHFDDDGEKACHSALRAVNLEMRREPSIDDTFSGTTAVVLMVRGRQIVVSNVGDSRAIIARPETVEVEGPDGSVQNKDIMKAYDLTNDQTPFREDERNRVTQCGAQVLTMDEVEGVREDLAPEEFTADDPPLLWVPNTLYPGTAFTRSIGDMLAERIGVVATPEVLVQELGADDRFIVLATDGVWEFLSSQDVADIVSRCFTPLDAARAVVAEAKRLWLELDCRTDDITCIVIFITGLQAPSKPVDLQKSVDIYSSLIGDWYGADYVPSVMGLARQAGRRSSIKKSAALLSYKSAAADLTLEDQASTTEQPYKELDTLPVKSAVEAKQLRAAIKANMLFADLDDEQVSMVVNLMEEVQVVKDEVIFSQGESGDWFYVIKSGTFDVLLKRAGATTEEQVHTYKSSWGTCASFGEMALMYNRPRPATVKARSEGILWRLHRKAFHRFQKERLQTEFETAPSEDYVSPGDLLEKTDEELESLDRAVKSNFLFANMTSEQKKAVFNKMERKVYDLNDVVYRQGEAGHWFYVVDSGEFDVCVVDPTGNSTSLDEHGKIVHTYKGGKHMTSQSSFGEQALMYGKPRGATVRAKTPGVLWALHRQAFQVAVRQFKFQDQLQRTPSVSMTLAEM